MKTKREHETDRLTRTLGSSALAIVGESGAGFPLLGELVNASKPWEAGLTFATGQLGIDGRRARGNHLVIAFGREGTIPKQAISEIIRWAKIGRQQTIFLREQEGGKISRLSVGCGDTVDFPHSQAGKFSEAFRRYGHYLDLADGSQFGFFASNEELDEAQNGPRGITGRAYPPTALPSYRYTRAPNYFHGHTFEVGETAETLAEVGNASNIHNAANRYAEQVHGETRKTPRIVFVRDPQRPQDGIRKYAVKRTIKKTRKKRKPTTRKGRRLILGDRLKYVLHKEAKFSSKLVEIIPIPPESYTLRIAAIEITAHSHADAKAQATEWLATHCGQFITPTVETEAKP